jgi:hypothetical protein
MSTVGEVGEGYRCAPDPRRPTAPRRRRGTGEPASRSPPPEGSRDAHRHRSRCSRRAAPGNVAGSPMSPRRVRREDLLPRCELPERQLPIRLHVHPRHPEVGERVRPSAEAGRSVAAVWAGPEDQWRRSQARSRPRCRCLPDPDAPDVPRPARCDSNAEAAGLRDGRSGTFDPAVAESPERYWQMAGAHGPVVMALQRVDQAARDRTQRGR